jgi:hypothetical protein
VVLVKIAMVGAAIVVLMAVAQSQHWAQRAGLTGTCYAVQAPSSNPTGVWYACKQGVLTSFPSLESDGCESEGILQHQEVWRCDAALVALPSY